MINGIQHIGIGVRNRDNSFDFYNNVLGFSVPISKHTGNCRGVVPIIKEDQQRNVVIALNPYGGGLVEIFQYITRKPVPPPPEVDFSYNGFLFYGLKVRNIEGAFNKIKEQGGEALTPRNTFSPMESFGWNTGVFKDPDGIYGILLEYPGSNVGYGRGKTRIGGVEYIAIGVSDIKTSIDFYKNILGYDRIIYQWEGTCPEWEVLFGKNRMLKRALMARSSKPSGTFRHFLRGGMIELIEVEGNTGKHNFEGRTWGDIGLMELCFDVTDIEKTLKDITRRGAEIIVPPYKQDMGMNTFATFSYIKDPDGSLLEFADIESLPVPYFFIRLLVRPSIIGIAKRFGLL